MAATGGPDAPEGGSIEECFIGHRARRTRLPAGHSDRERGRRQDCGAGAGRRRTQRWPARPRPRRDQGAARHPRAAEPERLVEWVASNVAAARSALAAAGLGGVAVVEADAGVTDVYAGAAPRQRAPALRHLRKRGFSGRGTDRSVTVSALLARSGRRVDPAPAAAGPDADGPRLVRGQRHFEEVGFDSRGTSPLRSVRAASCASSFRSCVGCECSPFSDRAGGQKVRSPTRRQ